MTPDTSRSRSLSQSPSTGPKERSPAAFSVSPPGHGFEPDPALTASGSHTRADAAPAVAWDAMAGPLPHSAHPPRTPPLLDVSPPRRRRPRNRQPPPGVPVRDAASHSPERGLPVRSSFRLTTSAEVTDDGVFEAVNGYLLSQPIGHGATGTVFLAQCEHSGEQKAVKVVSRARAGDNSGAALTGKQLSEANILKRLRHEHIVTLHEFIDDPHHDKMYLVMNYVPGGPVAQLSPLGFCTPLPVDAVREITAHVATALAYLHESGVVHGDVKPENILLDSEQGKAVLADFGVAHAIFEPVQPVAPAAPFFAEPRPAVALTPAVSRPGSSFWHIPASVAASLAASPCGPAVTTFISPAFASPERFQTYSETPTMAADMWALGVTLYALLFGRLPFAGDTLLDLLDSICHEVEVPAAPDGTAAFYAEFVAPLFWPEHRRPGAAALERALRDGRWTDLRPPTPPPVALSRPPSQPPSEGFRADDGADDMMLAVWRDGGLSPAPRTPSVRSLRPASAPASPKTSAAPSPRVRPGQEHCWLSGAGDATPDPDPCRLSVANSLSPVSIRGGSPDRRRGVLPPIFGAHPSEQSPCTRTAADARVPVPPDGGPGSGRSFEVRTVPVAATSPTDAPTPLCLPVASRLPPGTPLAHHPAQPMTSPRALSSPRPLEAWASPPTGHPRFQRSVESPPSVASVPSGSFGSGTTIQPPAALVSNGSFGSSGVLLSPPQTPRPPGLPPRGHRAPRLLSPVER